MEFCDWNSLDFALSEMKVIPEALASEAIE